MQNQNVILCVITTLIAFPLGFSLAGLFFPLYSILRKIFYVTLARNRLLKNAVKKNHVIEATNIGTDGTLVYKYANGRNRAFYQYEYNGKKYKRLFSSQFELPKTMKLYYQKNPAKAESATTFGLAENPTWLLQYLFLSISIGLISIFFVYDYLEPYFQNVINKL